MRMILKGAAIVLALVGTSYATVGTSNAAGFAITTSNNGRDHRGTSVAFDFGNIAYAYQDGYWDNNRRWHTWRNRSEHDSYRNHQGGNYRSGNHDRYRGQGWMGSDRSSVGLSFSFGDVAYGYQDGYWDNNRRWHKWQSRSDHDNYRKLKGNNYRSGNHDRYRGPGWQRD